MLFFYRSWLVSWDRPFDQPIPLPSGSPARTLREAANYIRKLPKSEYDKPEWRLAVQMLIDAAEDRGPMLFARMGIPRATERQQKRFRFIGHSPSFAAAEAHENPMTVLVYVNTSKQVGDRDHIKVFANVDAAEKWFEENDPEGVAFEYEVLE